MQIYLRSIARPGALDSLGLGDGHGNTLKPSIAICSEMGT